jgi:hypothetical protein
MIKGSEIRKADFPIESLLLDRWSPRTMSMWGVRRLLRRRRSRQGEFYSRSHDAGDLRLR